MSLTVDQHLENARAERAARLLELGPRPQWWRPFKRRAWDRKRAAITAVTLNESTMLLRMLYPRSSIEKLSERRHPAFHAITKSGKSYGDA